MCSIAGRRLRYAPPCPPAPPAPPAPLEELLPLEPLDEEELDAPEEELDAPDDDDELVVLDECGMQSTLSLATNWPLVSTGQQISDWLPSSTCDRHAVPSVQSALSLSRLQGSPTPWRLHPGAAMASESEVTRARRARAIDARAFTRPL